MDTKNKYRLQKITAASICGLMAVAFVGPALDKILALEEQWPQWTIYLLVIGGVLFIIAMIILVPSSWWKRIRYTILGFFRRLRKWCVWKFYGPKYTIGDPTFNQSEVSEVGQDCYETWITATFRIMAKSKSKPIRISLSSAHVCLEQRVQWQQQKVQLRLDTHQIIRVIQLKPNKKWSRQVNVCGVYRGGRDSIPNIKKKKDWGIWGILVTLHNGDIRPLHKGAKYQPKVRIIG